MREAISSSWAKILPGNWASILVTLASAFAIIVIKWNDVSLLKEADAVRKTTDDRQDAQIAELRQAAYGFGYDMKYVKGAVEEIRVEQKSMIKQFQEMLRSAPK